MKSVDEEWREFTEQYAQMSEIGLEALADEAYDLTDMARELLRAEIARRGLHLHLRDQPAPPDTSADMERAANFDSSELDLVNVARIFDLEDAAWYKNVLNNAGIPSYFGPDNVESVEALKAAFEAEKRASNKRGYEAGIECKVPSDYQQPAYQAFAQAPHRPNPEINADAEAEADYLAVCPRCHSPEIVFQGLETKAGGEPDVDSKYLWSCDACGYQWQDDGVEQQGSAAS